jgi:hypothetical protein
VGDFVFLKHEDNWGTRKNIDQDVVPLSYAKVTEVLDGGQKADVLYYHTLG